MATLTAKLTLTGNNLTSDALNASITDVLTITKDVVITRIVTSVASTKFLDNTAYGKCYVFLKNIDTTDSITIEKADAGDEYMTLAPGEFAFFPWDSGIDLFADASANTPVLEYMIFEA